MSLRMLPTTCSAYRPRTNRSEHMCAHTHVGKVRAHRERKHVSDIELRSYVIVYGMACNDAVYSFHLSCNVLMFCVLTLPVPPRDPRHSWLHHGDHPFKHGRGEAFHWRAAIAAVIASITKLITSLDQLATEASAELLQSRRNLSTGHLARHDGEQRTEWKCFLATRSRDLDFLSVVTLSVLVCLLGCSAECGRGHTAITRRPHITLPVLETRAAVVPLVALAVAACRLVLAMVVVGMRCTRKRAIDCSSRATKISFPLSMKK